MGGRGERKEGVSSLAGRPLGRQERRLPEGLPGEAGNGVVPSPTQGRAGKGSGNTDLES